MLTWSTPQEPNGVIISYEVTYRVSDSNLVTTNTTDLRFTIPSLTPGTNVTEISVSAYTSVGRGDPVWIPHLVTLIAPRKYTCTDSWPITILLSVAKVMITPEVVSATSIQVSWDRLDIPEITSYMVYYSQTGNSEKVTTVSSSENSVTIDNLLTDEEYQFQVVAVAELDGNMVMGERSNVSIARPTAPPPTTPPPVTTSASPVATEGQCESTLEDTTYIRRYNISYIHISCSCCSVCMWNDYLHYCCGDLHLDPNTVYSSAPTCGVLCLPLSWEKQYQVSC